MVVQRLATIGMTFIDPLTLFLLQRRFLPKKPVPLGKTQEWAQKLMSSMDVRSRIEYDRKIYKDEYPD
jgi:hypothetical protein